MQQQDFYKDTQLKIVSIITMILIVVLGLSIILYNPSISQVTTPTSHTNYQSKFNNLTSVSLYNLTTAHFIRNVTVQKVNRVSISATPSTVSSGQRLTITIIYSGIFSYNLYNASTYLSKVANTNYFGFYTQGSSDMLVLNNMPNASDYFVIIGSPNVYTPKGYSPYNYTATVFNVTPTSAASGKTWYLCGGNFLAYANSTWVPIFDNATFFRQNVATPSYINTISQQCAQVIVK